MTPTPPDPLLPVVVAVSGDGFDAALRFGAAEAVRDGGPLHVVHVAELAPGAAARSQEICLRAVDRARELVGHEVQVTSEIFHGELIEGLVELGRAGRVVVLQRHGAGGRRTDPRATSAKVAARATTPVVCVPRDWTARGMGTVTVGVDDTLGCGPMLREALVAARSRGAWLRVLHVDLPADDGDSEREIRSALPAAAEGLEDVPVGIEIVDGGTPLAALIEAMETSELLVLGRHHPLKPHRSRLGPVARTVVREASCPVLLLAASASVSPAEWVFEGNLA